MAFLAHCWLLIECFLIPHGLFRKCFYLSFYIHPFFLPFCFIFLWLHKLLLFLYSPFRILCCMALLLLRLVATAVFPARKTFYDAMEPPGCELVWISSNQLSSCLTGDVLETAELGSIEERDQDGGCSNDGPGLRTGVVSKTGEHCWIQERDKDGGCTMESWLNEYLYSERYNDMYDLLSIAQHGAVCDSESEICPSEHLCDHELSFSNVDVAIDDCHISSYATDLLLMDHEDFSTCFSNNFPAKLTEQGLIRQEVRQNKDSLRQNLTERFEFFKLLYRERLHGYRAISNAHFTSPGMSDSTGLSMARVRILRSLESDFELIYVAQTCLYWEELHHQYRQVQVLTMSENDRLLFHYSVLGKFQEFQILLERFVEEQKWEKQDNIQGRLSFHCTIQVPDVTGFTIEQSNKGAEAVRSNEVLKAIKKCIEAFWSYLQADDKKSSWKYGGRGGGIRRTQPPVEDPLNLELLYDVSKTLQKKGAMMKVLRGKKRHCWLKRKVEPLQTDDEKINLLFTMIEMRLVERVLKMSLISGSQLKWCREKLSSLEFRQGRVFRSSMSRLFPCF